MNAVQSAGSKRVWMTAAVLFVISMIPRAILYEDRLHPFWGGPPFNGDVDGWLSMAQYLTSHTDFSFYLFGARPPLFPILGAAVYRLGGDISELGLLQILIGSLTAVTAYLLARRLFLGISQIEHAEPLAFAAGLLMALDPALISTSATLQSEPLFNLCLCLFFYFSASYIHTNQTTHLILTIVFIALSMLTRPTAIFLWAAAAAMVMLLKRAWLRPVIAILLSGLLIYLGWSLRNLQYVNIFTYSTQANFHLLFYRAISAEYLATDRSLDDLRLEYIDHLDEIAGKPETDHNPEDFWSFMVVDDPAVHSEMAKMAVQKIVRYWPYAVLGTGIGLIRMYGPTLALPGWIHPIEIIYHLLLCAFALLGFVYAYRRERRLLVIAGIPILYITALTLISQTSGMDSRMTTGIKPLLIILSIYGAYTLWRGTIGIRAPIAQPDTSPS